MIFAILAAHYANEHAYVNTDTIIRRTWFSGSSGALPSKIGPRSLALNSAIILLFLTIILTASSFYFKNFAYFRSNYSRNWTSRWMVLFNASLRLESTPSGEIDNPC